MTEDVFPQNLQRIFERIYPVSCEVLDKQTMELYVLEMLNK